MICPAAVQDEHAKPVDVRLSARPLEPWADPRLKVTRGLVLWLDAGRLNAAQKLSARAEVSDGRPGRYLV